MGRRLQALVMRKTRLNPKEYEFYEKLRKVALQSTDHILLKQTPYQSTETQQGQTTPTSRYQIPPKRKLNNKS